ncbi:TPA: hypothetical protein ACH3X2_009270 [Trebouxia sp. C0005]
MRPSLLLSLRHFDEIWNLAYVSGIARAAVPLRQAQHYTLHTCSQHAQPDNSARVDPSKPIKGLLLERPQEPGPEECCQSGCSLCVWDMYKDNLHEYRVQQAQLRGETPPVKALDPFEEMELKLNSLAQEGKGPKAAET